MEGGRGGEHGSHGFLDLCGPGEGHADCAEDADFFFAFLCPTDCTDYTDLCPIRTGTAGGSEFIVNS